MSRHGLGILTVGRLELGLEEVSGPWEGDSACDAVALSLAVCLDAIRGGHDEVKDWGGSTGWWIRMGGVEATVTSLR